jgi:predicted RNA-binding protein with TRAM domain
MGKKSFSPPVKEGTVLDDVEVINVADKGDGVIKHEGYVIFVPGTKVGDVVSVKITKALNKFGFAEVVTG